ncbi:THO complex subunit 7 homolog [Macrobrachium nipponense]|uniref:THO complex subunit 7 homolog n=1 Tax=Macrobrachium nipponense TaxID=159736 RepID=UPI0030C7B3A8
MGDEDIIRRRLMIDGDGTGDVRQLMMFMKAFIKWCGSDDTSQESQNQYDRLLTQLAGIEHSSLKWKGIIDMNELEIKHYDGLREETSKNVKKACVAIEDAKQELEEARQVRRNRLEYDALAKLIKEHPPRSDTADKLTLLNQQLQSLKAKRDSLEEKLSLRRKQLHVLVTSLYQLKQTLHDDSTPVHDADAGKRPLVDLADSPVVVDLTSTQEMDTT